MGYELLVAFFLSVTLPLTVLGFIAFWAMNHNERLDLEDTWESFARRRNRDYVPARGDWPNRTSPAVRWEQNARSFELKVRGVESGARTSVSTAPRERLLGDFTLRSSSSSSSSPRNKTNDPFFDAAFAITHERPRHVALRVFGENKPVRQALLSFWLHDDVELRYKRGRLFLEWPGRESNEHRIDNAEQTLTIIAAAIEAEFEAASSVNRVAAA